MPFLIYNYIIPNINYHGILFANLSQFYDISQPEGGAREPQVSFPMFPNG